MPEMAKPNLHGTKESHPDGVICENSMGSGVDEGRSKMNRKDKTAHLEYLNKETIEVLQW